MTQHVRLYCSVIRPHLVVIPVLAIPGVPVVRAVALVARAVMGHGLKQVAYVISSIICTACKRI
jgi:hypothetical protein